MHQTTVVLTSIRSCDPSFPFPPSISASSGHLHSRDVPVYLLKSYQYWQYQQYPLLYQCIYLMSEFCTKCQFLRELSDETDLASCENHQTRRKLFLKCLFRNYQVMDSRSLHLNRSQNDVSRSSKNHEIIKFALIFIDFIDFY